MDKTHQIKLCKIGGCFGYKARAIQLQNAFGDVSTYTPKVWIAQSGSNTGIWMARYAGVCVGIGEFTKQVLDRVGDNPALAYGIVAAAVPVALEGMMAGTQKISRHPDPKSLTVTDVKDERDITEAQYVMARNFVQDRVMPYTVFFNNCIQATERHYRQTLGHIGVDALEV